MIFEKPLNERFEMPTPESDWWKLGDEHGPKDDNLNGWFHFATYLWLPPSIKQELADAMGIRGFYSIGEHRTTHRIAIQPNRELDPRNKKVAYQVLKEEYAEPVLKILHRNVTNAEREESEEHWRNDGFFREVGIYPRPEEK